MTSKRTVTILKKKGWEGKKKRKERKRKRKNIALYQSCYWSLKSILRSYIYPGLKQTSQWHLEQSLIKNNKSERCVLAKASGINSCNKYPSLQNANWCLATSCFGLTSLPPTFNLQNCPLLQRKGWTYEIDSITLREKSGEKIGKNALNVKLF